MWNNVETSVKRGGICLLKIRMWNTGKVKTLPLQAELVEEEDFAGSLAQRLYKGLIQFYFCKMGCYFLFPKDAF